LQLLVDDGTGEAQAVERVAGQQHGSSRSRLQRSWPQIQGGSRFQAPFLLAQGTTCTARDACE
jgi:hypothetical protein